MGSTVRIEIQFCTVLNCQLHGAIEKAHCKDPSKQLAVKEEEKEMSEQSQKNSFIAKWGSAFSESLSKSLDMNNGVWPIQLKGECHCKLLPSHQQQKLLPDLQKFQRTLSAAIPGEVTIQLKKNVVKCSLTVLYNINWLIT